MEKAILSECTLTVSIMMRLQKTTNHGIKEKTDLPYPLIRTYMCVLFYSSAFRYSVALK